MTSYERKAFERANGTHRTRNAVRDRDGKPILKYGKQTQLAEFSMTKELIEADVEAKFNSFSSQYSPWRRIK